MRYLIAGVLLCLVGCVNLVDEPGKGGETKPSVETVWTCIAEDVEAGAYQDSDELILVVDHLRERSRIDDAAVQKFNGVFPQFRQEGGTRALTKDDASKLRGL